MRKGLWWCQPVFAHADIRCAWWFQTTLTLYLSDKIQLLDGVSNKKEKNRRSSRYLHLAIHALRILYLSIWWDDLLQCYDLVSLSRLHIRHFCLCLAQNKLFEYLLREFKPVRQIFFTVTYLGRWCTWSILLRLLSVVSQPILWFSLLRITCCTTSTSTTSPYLKLQESYEHR